MYMIYVTGDTHGNVGRLSNKHWLAARSMTKDDFVIICGDFGLVWDYHGESSMESHSLDWLESRPFSTLFVDGNHENHKRLGEYPVETWNGGKVHKIRPSVIHLMRGQIYDLPFGDETRRIFTFGGARSHDIQDGVLDPVLDAEKIRQWKHHNAYNYDNYKFFRVIGQSWWPEEMPTLKEMEEAIDNLDNAGWEVDYIFTHDCSGAVKKALFDDDKCPMDEMNIFLDVVRETCNYKRWFFGHHHDDLWLSGCDCLLYEDIIPVNKRIDEEMLQLLTT